MAKKVVATLKKEGSAMYTKVVRAVKSEKSGAYTFEEKVINKIWRKTFSKSNNIFKNISKGCIYRYGLFL